MVSPPIQRGDLCRRLGVSRQAVQHWIDGARPSAEHIAELEALGIPKSAWDRDVDPMYQHTWARESSDGYRRKLLLALADAAEWIGVMK